MSDPEPVIENRGRLWNRAQVATDPDFTARVKQALIAAAVAITNEADTTPLHAQRVDLAEAVLTYPEDWTRRIAPSIANNANVGTGTSDPSIESDDGDNALEYVVTTVWDAYARTFPAPPEAQPDADVG